nr:uncharacterized protein LOC113806971 [Penaeus vannamei]
MVSVLLCALLAAGASYALVPMPGTSPWLDTSMCAPTDSLMMCQLKKGQCSPLNTVFSPPGGPIKTITDCANATGLVLGPQFFMSAGSLALVIRFFLSTFTQCCQEISALSTGEAFIKV